MSSVIVLFIVMLIIAAAAFAPLGFFIYRFNQNSDQPLGEEQHGDHPSAINDFAESVIKFVQSRLGKK